MADIKNSVSLRVKVKYHCEDPPEDQKGKWLRPADVAEILNENNIVGEGATLMHDGGVLWDTEFEFQEYNWADYGFHIESKQELNTGVWSYRAWRCKDWDYNKDNWPPTDAPHSEWRESEEMAIANLMEKFIQAYGEEQ